MRRIRKVYLQNATGDRFGLNGEKGVYVSSLAGLGITLAPTFGDLGRGFFVAVSSESEPQNSVACTLTFTRNPYQSYKSFVDWLSAAGTVKIVYDTVGVQEYFRDVTLNFLQKGELNEVGWLEIPCSLYCNTPWYLPKPTSLVLEGGGTDECKRYDYEYTDELIYGSDSTETLSGTIVGAGHIPGSLELTYYGAITNPTIRLVGDLSGKTYGVCSVAAALSASDRLKFSSRYEDSYVKKISAEGVETDLLDVLDLRTTPFFHIPVDEPCTLSLESDTIFTGSADLQVYYYYRSV